jgi:hypothetical protein
MAYIEFVDRAIEESEDSSKPELKEEESAV